MSLPIPCCFGKYFFSIGQCAEKLTARRAEIVFSYCDAATAASLCSGCGSCFNGMHLDFVFGSG
jgi:hypothetical protein